MTNRFPDADTIFTELNNNNNRMKATITTDFKLLIKSELRQN